MVSGMPPSSPAHRIRSRPAGQLDELPAALLDPVLLVSDGAVVVDQPLPLSALIEGLATDHVPGHTRQLLDLRRPARC